jgi:serine phosphatase RsbU (regulator of sigma subunit)
MEAVLEKKKITEKIDATTLIFYGLNGLMAVICILSFITPVSWLNNPFAGFLVYEPPYVGSYSLQDWPGRQAGLKFMDRITSVEGTPIWSGHELTEIIQEKKPGTPVNYTVASKGQRREITVPVSTFGLKDFLLTFFATNFLCGFILCVLGAIVVILKPNMLSSWVFMFWSQCLGGYMISGFEIMSSYRLVRYHVLVASLYPVITLHLALIFPDKKRIVYRFPALQYLIYIPFVVLILGWQIYLTYYPDLLRSQTFLSSLLSYKVLGSVTRTLLLITVVIFIILVFHSMRTAQSALARQRARMILIGAAIGWVSPVAFMLVSHLMKVNPTWNFLPFLVIFFPISIAYSIIRHNLFDADTIIRRTAGYAIVTTIIVGAYVLVSLIMNFTLGAYEVAQSRMFPIVFTLGVILVFNPLRNRIQALVDHVFFRKEYNYGAVVDKASRAMTSLLELGQVLRHLMHPFVHDLYINTTSIMLFSPEVGGYKVRLAEGEMQNEVEGKSFHKDVAVVQILESEKKELTRYDVLEDPKYKEHSEMCAQQFEAVRASLMVPLFYQDKLIGLFNLGEKKSGKPYNAQDIDLFHALANQGAVAIENARLFQENLEKQRMEEELNIARDLQMSMLPAVCPEIKGFQIAASSSPAREVGGDFYDFIEMKDDKVGLVVADVTGKSVSGALVMSSSRSVFRMLSEEKLTVGDIMSRANRRIKKDIKSGMFVALLYAVVDATKGKVSLCSAGQTQPIHLSARDGEAKLVDTEGDNFPLGILDEADYRQTEVWLPPGDTIVFYTDGIVEAMNEAEEIYGFERLLEVVKAGGSMTAEALHQEILNNVSEFTGNAPQHDDLTVIVVKALR